MTNSILSSCFMFAERTVLTCGQIKKMTSQLYDYMQAKKCRTYVAGPP